MEPSHYVGLDVSLEFTAVCVVDQQGATVWHGVGLPTCGQVRSEALTRFSKAEVATTDARWKAMRRRQARPDQVSRRARSRPDRFAPPPAVAFGQSGPPLRATRRDYAGRGGETALQPNRETSNLAGINEPMRQERAGRHDQGASGSAQSNQGMDVFMPWRSSCHAGG